jgi:AraC-like DNA-binding protein
MNEYLISDDCSEIVSYEDSALPVKAWSALSAHFPTLSEVNHWHNDIEFAYVVKGGVFYNIDGIVTELHQGQMVFINSRHMHFGFQQKKRDCEMVCLTFHPSLMSDISSGKYIELLLSKNAPAFLVFSKDKYMDNSIIDVVLNIKSTYSERVALYEFDILSSIYSLIGMIIERIQSASVEHPMDNKKLLAMYYMTGFVQKNYKENINVNDIAAAGLVCRSRCCEFFRKYLDKTPMEYLMEYRINKGIELLYSKNLNITEVAYACGFNSSSYFTESFTKVINCTPTEYRKRI